MLSHKVNSIISRRNPSLYCTLTLMHYVGTPKLNTKEHYSVLSMNLEFSTVYRRYFQHGHFISINSRSCQLRIDYLIGMNEVRTGEQKEHKYLYFEMFYGGQKLHKYFRSLFINDTFCYFAQEFWILIPRW